MMLLIGINQYSFTDGKTGELISGCNVHVINDNPDSKGFIGRETVKFSLSNDKLNRFLGGRSIDEVIDTEVAVNYNRFGKVSELVSVG